MTEFRESITNKASLDNLPESFTGLLEDILGVVDGIYGRYGIGSVFWRGSLMRGDFQYNLSDADIVVITIDRLPTDHIVRRKTALDPVNHKWRKLAGLEMVDMVAMSEDAMDRPNRAKDMAELAVDGVKVTGDRDYDMSRYLPNTRLDWAQVHTSSKRLRARGVRASGLTEAMQKRQMVKHILRSMNDLAIVKGAPFTLSLLEMERNVEAYCPDLLDDFRRVESFSDLELGAMYDIAERTFLYLEAAGVEFDL